MIKKFTRYVCNKQILGFALCVVSKVTRMIYKKIKNLKGSRDQRDSLYNNKK